MLRGAKRRGNPYLFRQKSAKNAEFTRFRNGLPRQCAHWLGMTALCAAGRCGHRPLRGREGCVRRGVRPYGAGHRGRRPLRSGTSHPKGICSAALHCRTPFPTGRDVEDAVPYGAGRRGAGHTKGIKREAPAGASQLVKKVRTDFFDKLRQNRKIKNSILFCDFGRCGG